MLELFNLNISSSLTILALILFGYQFLIWTYQHFISSIPAVDEPWFAFLIRKPKQSKQVITEAYYKYSKNLRTFRISGLYVIPPALSGQYRKALSNVLNSGAAIDESLKFGLILGYDHVDVVNFVKIDVTRNIPKLIPVIRDEIRIMFDRSFSSNDASEKNESNWRHVQLYSGLLTGIGCIASRMFAGEKYAHNIEFTRTASKFANGVMYQTLLFMALPRFLIPLFIRILPTRWRIDRLRSFIRSDVLHYIKNPITTDEIDNSATFKETKLLPFLVKYVQAANGYAGASEEKVLKGTIGRLMGLMFAAIDTTTITSSQALYDIISNPYNEYAGPIKQEFIETLARHGGEWNQKALGELRLLDSFIKESQRINPIGNMLPTRLVMPNEGFTMSIPNQTPGASTVHFPKGAQLLLPISGIHSDPTIYDEPTQFKGFRFAQDAVPSSQPTDKFLSFGHGLHACPGRFLALIVVKLIIIEFLTRYEYKQIERPKNMTYSLTDIPNMNAKIIIRDIEM